MNEQDSRFWRPGSRGRYNVKSGYLHYTDKRSAKGEAESSFGKHQEEDWWKSIWKIDTPPKIKIFWWKLVNDAIAAEGNLLKHHVPMSPVCSWCNTKEPNTVHALFLCPGLKEAWKLLDLWKEIKKGEFMKSMDFAQLLCSNKIAEKREKIAGVTWRIWRERWHEDPQVNIRQKINVEWALELLRAYKEANNHLKSFRSTVRMLKKNESDRARYEGVTTLVDASLNKEKGWYSVGFMLIKGEEEPIDAGCKRINPSGSIFRAKIHVIREGMRKCRLLGLRQVRIWTDSLEAIRAIHSKEKCFSPESTILEEIWDEMQDDLVRVINYIMRKQNEMAHELAKLAFYSQDPQDWSGVEVPIRIRNITQHL